MTNSQWVMSHLCQSLLFMWQIASEWGFSWDNLTLYILSHHDQQQVCDTLLSMPLYLIAWGRKWVELHSISMQSIKSHLMANRESVMLLANYFITFHASNNVWQNVSIAAFLLARQPYLIPPQIECEWGCTFAVQLNSISFYEQEGEFCYCVGQAHLSPSHHKQQVSHCSFYSQTLISLHDQQKVSNNTVLCQIVWHISYYSGSTVCK